MKLWNQFDLDQLQALVDRHFGKQPRYNRWRLALMLDSRGMTMREYERVRAEEAETGSNEGARP